MLQPPVKPPANEAVKLGLVINRRARRMRSLSHREALLSAAAGLPVVMPETVSSMPEQLAQLVHERGVNVLAVAGGDGTLHATINALASIRRGAERRWPMIAALSGGTLNIVARTARTRELPERTLARLRQRLEGRPVSQLLTRDINVLAVDSEISGRHYGFVFGSETLHHAIELYVRFGAGYGGLTKFLGQLARGALWGSGLWREEGWKMGPHPGDLVVDGRRWPRYLAAVATTVDLSLAVFAIRAIRVPPGQAGCVVKVLEEATPGAVVAQVPALLMHRSTQHTVDLSARTLALHGPFTLDGELFDDLSCSERRPLTVTVADEKVRLLIP